MSHTRPQHRGARPYCATATAMREAHAKMSQDVQVSADKVPTVSVDYLHSV